MSSYMCVIAILNAYIYLGQIYREGFTAILDAPGSYCAYACMYITCCLIKVCIILLILYKYYIYVYVYILYILL